MPRKTQMRHERLKPTKVIGQAPSSPAPQVDHMYMVVMNVTPEQAAVWLEGKCPNRNVSQQVVARYARDMLAGSWHLNGEPIIFSMEGGLLDGQHRLWAVLESGKTVKMAVTFGAHKDSMYTYDMGRNRNFGDVLAIKGLKNTNTLAGAARWEFWYQHIRHGSTKGRASQASHDELMETINNKPLLMSAAQMVDARPKASRYVTKSILAFVLGHALEADPEKAEAFLDKLASGEGMEKDHPILKLRERMAADLVAKVKLEKMVVAAYAIKSWNYFLVDRPLGTLKWDRDNKHKPEAFPTFVER